MTDQSTFLSEVESFLVREGLAPTTFGELALSDRHFVRQIRAGRRCWPETIEKVRAFMVRHTSADFLDQGDEVEAA